MGRPTGSQGVKGWAYRVPGGQRVGLPNVTFKMAIRASEVEAVGTTFPVHSLKNNITGWTIE